MITGEELPEEDEIYRIALCTDRDRKNKKIPAVRCFSLSPSDKNKLSVDWNIKTSPEESIARVGATYRFNKEEYKPFDNRELYAMEVGFLNDLDDVEKTVYDPIHFPSPEPGKVNNPAHSLIVFTESFATDQAKEPETLLKIRDHAKDKKVDVNMEEVAQLVKGYRENK